MAEKSPLHSVPRQRVADRHEQGEHHRGLKLDNFKRLVSTFQSFSNTSMSAQKQQFNGPMITIAVDEGPPSLHK